MAAISVQMYKASRPRLDPKMFFETFLRVLITLSAAMSVVLSSISVCDGQWLVDPAERTFNLWKTCRTAAEPQCDAEMAGLNQGMVLVRTAVCLAVVVAIFGLELLMVSQLCEDGNSRGKWNLGSLLLLISFFLSSSGTLTYIALLRDFVTFSSLSLAFWCQFLGVFLFFLNGISGLYFNHLTL
ncbi:voltage-dependent calcium channel gamma-like subunit [Pelobates cultripes]|uniref:Voltage-dependent calcium channel gamma-like subunit n=1 Tax=Pelobates cultripes TaxID=61616 RepID=A0AAD1SP67_PELCU|nr:voltage-dependent calcium channel gamma-like subunit [Pelobates cultripes]CAH2304947.1 voltage-dependent calcium channel gamma-like subunit [Pelobates cultripes]